MSTKPIIQNRLSFPWQTNFLGVMQWVSYNAKPQPFERLGFDCKFYGHISRTGLVREAAFNNIQAE